jgi:hypothetical protein
MRGPALELSHYSVEKYLKSPRIKTGPASFFAMEATDGDRDLASLCTTYLGYDDFAPGPCLSKDLFYQRLSEYPFLSYAANFWFEHAREPAVQESCLQRIARFWKTRDSPKHVSWLQAFRDPDETYDIPAVSIKSILYYPSLWGLEWLCQALLLNMGEDFNTREVNVQGGYFGNPLQAAAVNGHKRIVDLLLANGAKANKQGGRWINALRASSHSGNPAITEALLDHGANMMAAKGSDTSALLVATSQGHIEVVETLIKRGADVNEAYGALGPLQTAAHLGDTRMVELLIRKGADVNAGGKGFNNALLRAAWAGHAKTVETLLKHGARVDQQNPGYLNATMWATRNKHTEVARLLLESGVDVLF